MLKMTNAEIKLITDINMHLMIEKGIRECRCEPTYYHAKANNKYVNPNFDKEKDEESYIISLDANSLYTSAMCYKLPFSEPNFDKDITKYSVDYILNLDPYGKYLYVFVVDIPYPSKLHDRDFEFLILCDQSIPPNDKTKKTMSSFYDKKNYTISLYMLKYCLEKGLILRKIHHVIYAEHSDFMKPYITFNNEKRTEWSIKKDKFGVDRCKLMNNANFAKQTENLRKYKDTRIANNEDKAKIIATKVIFNECHILSENVTLYDMRKPSVLLDKPIIIGFTILEIAKLEMNIHYDSLKEIFGDNMCLLYTDTDSFKLSIKDTNPYELDDHIDTSSFSDNNKISLKELYDEKCELNQVIKENTYDEKLKMIAIVISKYCGYPVYEITVR